MRTTVGLLILSLAAPTLGFSQSAPATQGKLTFAEVAAAAKTYLRDSAEFPMRATVEFVASDLSGHIRKHKTGKADYLFQGYNPRSMNGTVKLRGSRAIILLAAQNALSVLSIGVLLDSEPAVADVFEVENVSAEGLVTVRMRSNTPCEPFQWSASDQMPSWLCGTRHFQLATDDLSLRSYVFDSEGLPFSGKVEPFGQATISSYHVATEFQKVLLPGDPKPFLVPKEVEATVTTDKGKLVITSRYEAKK